MELENFEAGHFERGPSYKYFVPGRINQEWTWQSAALNTLLERAAVKLGELNSCARLGPQHRPVYSAPRHQGSCGFEPD